MFIARPLLAVLSQLLSAPSWCFAAAINSSLLAVWFLLFATSFLFLTPCHSLLTTFRMLSSLFPGCYSRVIFCSLVSSNSLFAGINSILFIVNRYWPPTACPSCSLPADSQAWLGDSLSLLGVCCSPLAAPPSHLVEQNICSFLSALGSGIAKSEKLWKDQINKWCTWLYRETA